MQSASVALMINPNLLGRHTVGKGERLKPSGLKSAYPDLRIASRKKKDWHIVAFPENCIYRGMARFGSFSM